MATRRTVDLLPEIFRTNTNQEFFAATLDQLVQEPDLKKIQGYVGRRVGPGVNPADHYVTEPSAVRTDYQLEPGVIFLKPDTSTAIDAITYPGMIDALSLNGADVTQQDRLFGSEFYTWDPFCDLDKFTNYSQYYWLAQGPDSVDIAGVDIPLTDGWTITRTNSYQFSDVAGDNPIITLVRGGNYTFDVNQVGNKFWIQAAPGIDGRMPGTPNISSRGVLGVINNGEDQGTVTFNVPLKTAQDFYYNLSDIGTVDLITNLKFNQLNNIYVSEFLASNPQGIDGITNLDGLTIVFTNTITDAEAGGWQVTTQYDPLVNSPGNTGALGSFDTLLFDQTSDIDSQSQRYSVWQIEYVYDTEGNPFMRLNSILVVNNLSKFRINFGTQYASTQWYKNASGYFEEVPLLSAVLDTLWYQDGTNPDIFGQIKLIDQDQEVFIDVDDIIGATNYTSPNGVVFTNGLKVQFRGAVKPARYQNLEFYVEGVGTGPGITKRVGFVDGQAYFGPWHLYQGRKLTGQYHSTTEYQQYIYETAEESLLNNGAGAPLGAPLPTAAIPGATLGNGIKLLPVTNYVTPETYTRSDTIPYDSTSYDSQPYDASLNAPQVPDYLTINRASEDLNPWTRSNRWFHVDVIRATAAYNNEDIIVDNSLRAKRPIIEFRANLKLFDFGTQGKQPVNIINFSATDAFSNINGQSGYSTDGYTFINGSRVIFANDADPEVRNKIYEVQFIDPDNSGNLIIDLLPTLQGDVLVNQTIVCLSGNKQQGKSFWFDGINWVESQQKTGVNQAPLFDVYDANNISFGNKAVYPSSTFTGSRLFGYAIGNTQVQDTVLGFALRYLNIDNVGDIVFENYIYNDTFVYVKDKVSYTEFISTGFARQYLNRIDYTTQIGWQTAITENVSRQVFRFDYTGSPLILDVPVDVNNILPPIQMYVEGKFIDPTNYVYEVIDATTVITLLNTAIPSGTIIEVEAISNVASTSGFYQVPQNLSNNPLNENSSTFTLGTIRNHYESIGENLRAIQGPIVGANNTRDLGNILVYGDFIVQNSSPLALTGVFLRRQQYELFSAIEFNNREYTKYKDLMLDLVSKGNFGSMSASDILDSVMEEISLGRSTISPFYWSDMVPFGQNYTENKYTYSFISTPTFDTIQSYDFTSSNFKGLLVFLNGKLLTINYDYVVSTDTPTLTITVPLAVGDVIIIREFTATYGNYVPNTPTKMGLYPAYMPQIYVDTTYVNPTTVIQGHDGSITVAFRDIRDEVLLEFEKRIFNNLKINSPIPLVLDDVLPGQFRKTDYTLSQINQILSTDFLSWVGWNKLDYTSQTLINGNQFTYNYSQTSNRLTGEAMPVGAWRGLYNYFFDTDTPNTTPWEMLGLTQKPSWWEEQYGPAPYTSGNTVLWDDLSNGLINDPLNPYVDVRYIRPNLMEILPVGSEGELLNPLQCVVGNYDATSFRRNWTVGDDGPVENTWKSSSSWPFAVMRLLALTKPAKFFGLFADRDRYVYDSALEQYLWDKRYRLNANKLTPLYGNNNSKASYLNWIIDYNRQLGINSTDGLTITLNNIDVRLCWRAAGFTDKKYLKIYTERATPDSSNTSLLLPDESYQVLLYKNQPFEEVNYSSVIIQKSPNGWTVLGYSQTNPYFEILVSRSSGNYQVISAGSQEVRVAIEYTDNVIRVPYGFTFTNTTGVCDFLASYGKLLENQGLLFTNRENGYELNWMQMAQEFLYWTGQGWGDGSIINLNPGATSIGVERAQAVVDNIYIYGPENIILNQNRQPLPSTELVIDRVDNLFRATSLTSNTINYLNLRFTAYEHLIVLDNVSIFADLIYQPVTGARQDRIRVSGWLSAGWTGLVNAPGFVLNQDNITEWVANRKYSKGQIVLFKDEYWTASTIIQPSQSFDYGLWVKSDYNQIQKGLLPNAANQSTQLAQAYSVYDANLEQEIDLFSYGLIGFRAREYMQALNLDDISQVNLYQQFLKSKGTDLSAELFTRADLGKETAEYKIYEYWAMLRSQYGATANRSYFELLLNQADLHSDPCIIQVALPHAQNDLDRDYDQEVLLENVWKSSTILTSPNILPTTLTTPLDKGLPMAGYVNLNDVDMTAFDFEVGLNNNASIEDIGVNTTVWVANVNNYDWGVYRSELIPGDIISVSDNLNNRALIQFDKPHGLSPRDMMAIKYFDSAIDGIYRVLAVPSITTILVPYTFTGDQTTFTGMGVGFTLQTARVAQPSDIINLPYARSLIPGARVWVDNNGSGRWEVIEKTDPFSGLREISPPGPVENSRFGASISQGFQNLSALIGAPGYNLNNDPFAPGAIYTYVKTQTDQYEQNSILQLATTDTSGYGNALDMGDQQWAIAGASLSLGGQGYSAVIYRNPGSNVFEQRQLLVRDPLDWVTVADGFGHAVTMSSDERWLFVSAPAANKVYAYARIDYQTQAVEYIAAINQNFYSFANSIIVDSDEQLVVAVNGVILTLGVDYSVTGTNVVFPVPPYAGSLVQISRRSSLIFNGDGSTTIFSLSSVYSVTDVYSLTVYINEVLQRPIIDYTVDGSKNVIFTVPPGNGVEVFCRAETYFAPVATLTSALPGDANYGFSVSTSTNGRQVIVGCPDKQVVDSVTNITYNNAGSLYIYNRVVQRFQVTDLSVTSYTTSLPLVSPTRVTVNNVELLNSNGNIGGNYSISGNTITITSALEIGDIIEIESNQFELEQIVISNNPATSARLGYASDLCINDCSLYIGVPFISNNALEDGQVEYRINQSRVYGTSTSTIANPTLTPGDFLRVNNYFVTVSGTTVEELVADINNASIPNVVATMLPNLEFVGDNGTKIFDVGSIYSSAASYTTKVLVNGTELTSGIDYSYNPTTEQITLTVAPVVNSIITVVAGRFTVSVKNNASAVPSNKVQISPASGTVFADIGMVTYAYQQTISAPVVQEFSHFGKSVFISDDAITLVVGAPDGTQLSFMTFDKGTTTFDSSSMLFFDATPQSGVVYTYDALASANPSVNNPRRFVFGQQIVDNNNLSLDQFGASVDYTTGTLLIGSPGTDYADSQASYGRATELRNKNFTPAWQVKRVQSPTVDISLLNTVYMYDRVSGQPKQYFDYFNPSQGRMLGAIEQNIDYTGAIDPAAYNVGPINNFGNMWAAEHVGEIWWDTSSVRFIDTNQDDPVYASRRWGQIFPGSTVRVYQWVVSDVPPAQYTGPGTPRDTTSFVISSSLNQQGIFATQYFFWVTGITSVANAARKTLSVETITRYIESPRSSGISYIAPINASTIAIYNGLEYISAQDTILHIEYDQQKNDAAVHVEYQLIPQGRGDGFLVDALYTKLQDSFCGANEAGGLVPDPLLPISEQYGVQMRPRQSMFVNRFLALQNYLTQANNVLKLYPITETRSFSLLNSEEPEPTASSGQWNKRVANYEELTYQILVEVPLGYLYLVANDANYSGRWTIYQVVAGRLPGEKTLLLVRVQNYNTKLYWNRIDWYLPGYNSAARIVAEVPTYSALATLSVAEGSSVKVTSNAQGKFEIYQLTNAANETWTRVGLEDGTIEFSATLWDYNLGRYGFDVEVFDAQFFDQAPIIETRKVIQAINQELFIDELLIERNRLLTLMFNYILSEQQAPEWLTKTSLVDVDHTIRRLLPYQSYRRDNQDFVLNYIKEVKPYHVQIREFNLIYEGQDTYNGTINDFDLPAYWDPAQNLFISPVLDNTGQLSTTSSIDSANPLWQTLPYDQWYQNYLLSVEDVTIIDGGSGYTIAPEVVVTGDCITPAVITARVNSAGAVVELTVVSPGSGYLTTAMLELVGGNGTGARAIAVMGNNLVRDIITTIKYDRYQYSTTVTDWQADVNYDNGTLVRYDNRVWEASSGDSSGVIGNTFDPQDWTLVPAGNLTGVDRTMGYYVPQVNEPGLDLALLMTGIDYPGVQVYGPDFDQNTGFDVGNFDINPFDNIAYGPEGLPTYDPAILDAIYESSFTDPYLGTLPTSINVDGGEFVDTYSSHAPEELVPGAIFDTLDMRVFTTPGADWTGDGHGFPLAIRKYEYTSLVNIFSFANLTEHLVTLAVWNQTQKIQLSLDVDYVVDWVAQTVTVVSSVVENDVIVIAAYGVGGGNQLYVNSYNGDDVGNSIVVPVNYDQINQFVVFVNGEQTTTFVYAQYDTYSTQITFANTYGPTDYISLVAMGLQTPQYSWSSPITQYFVSAGELSYTLSNYMGGTNAVNVVVTKNGVRARPPESVEYINDGSSLQYYCPDRGGYSPMLVSDNDVYVYINNVPLVLGVDFVVDPWNGYSASRTITLTTMPAPGAVILISVKTAAQYYISGNTLIWNIGGSLTPIAGDIIAVTSYNDTAQQDLLTQVFVGPTSQGILVSEGYGSTDFDSAEVNNTPGSFDFSTGTSIDTNVFDTGRDIGNASRLTVTLDGFYLFEGIEYTIVGTSVVLSGAPINASQVVVIESMTQSVVPDEIGFRIFQDMRGLQSTYRITRDSTSQLLAPLAETDDVIYVANALAFGEPNLAEGIFGFVTIDGERIAYRVRDVNTNTLSGLRRGTAGTAIAAHTSGTPVYDIGVGNLLPAEYQNYSNIQNFLADGTTTTFTSDDINLVGMTQAEIDEAVEVYVGGIYQQAGYTVTASAPVSIEFTVAPTANYQVTIVVKRGLSWYQPGPFTPSNGIPLQEQETVAARFIRGY